MKEILLHACCGPCTLYPVEVLREGGREPVCYFYNPNIHPFSEFERRVAAMEEVSDRLDLQVIWDGSGYGLHAYLDAIGDELEPAERCPRCYRIRLEKTALLARRLGMRAFSTTLLYSKYQMHELIKEMGGEVAAKHGLEFCYRDFREGWKRGIELARSLGIYRQPYCGCIFSEEERYRKKAQRMRKRWSSEPSV